MSQLRGCMKLSCKVACVVETAPGIGANARAFMLLGACRHVLGYAQVLFFWCCSPTDGTWFQKHVHTAWGAV
jgi:hypothetical protein